MLSADLACFSVLQVADFEERSFSSIHGFDNHRCLRLHTTKLDSAGLLLRNVQVTVCLNGEVVGTDYQCTCSLQGIPLHLTRTVPPVRQGRT
jgi:hypothetical protein